METFLYIVVAIAIMAYQIYNEKNKKEQRKNAVNRPPVKRIDPNEELHKDLTQMFGSLSGVNGLEDDSKSTESDKNLKYVKSVPSDFTSRHKDIASQEFRKTQLTGNNNKSQVKEKYMPDIVPMETLEAQAYNIDVPINKTEAETTQLLKDIYNSSEISGFDSGDGSHKKLDIKSEDFDPRLFILYSEIAKPKFID